ncbi:MAG: hypothetical protein IPO07_08735 [Haliscomenobacter sp.]|nr:hypothetical protein [Haliscomenobacter sp.]MBK9488863.1 hypothetical protein [Haliscomenobacter sp.]
MAFGFKNRSTHWCTCFDFASVFDRRKVQIDSFTDEDEPKKYICISSINLGPTSSINLRIEFPDAIAAFLDDDAFTFTIEDADKHSNWVKELHFPKIHCLTILKKPQNFGATLLY